MTLPINYVPGSQFTAAAADILDGAVNRNTGKLINPLDSAYGAAGNGITDDTAAINAALAAASNRGTVILPAGSNNFLYNGTITIPDGVCLMGGGHGFNQDHLRAGSAASLINVTGNYSQLRDLSINGNDLGQIGIRVAFTNRNSMTSVLVHRFTQAGLVFDGAQNCTLLDVSAYNNATVATPSGWPGVAQVMFINGAQTMTMVNLTTAQGSGGTNSNYSAIIITNIFTDARFSTAISPGGPNGLLRFYGGIHETYSSVTGAARILATDANPYGYNSIFHDVIIVGPSNPATIQLGPNFPGPLVFDDCQFHNLQAAYPAGPFLVQASSGQAIFTGTSVALQGALTAHNSLSGGAQVVDATYSHIGGTGSTLVAGSVNGIATALTLWTGTAAQYAAIVTKNAQTVYVVTP